jgi:O-methyltransferase involved in polyketide biosynthesis
VERKSDIQNAARDFQVISPSAKALLLLKGITNIPFARTAAELVSLPDTYEPEFQNKDIAFWKRVVHFEERYWSVDQLLSQLDTSNVLELSSGFSFRGLDLVTRKDVHYTDTDLPQLISQKKELVGQLTTRLDLQLKGTLSLQPLNALDEGQFKEIESSLPEGPVTVVNEGLLMYLDVEEKRRLCANIHRMLKNRGGCWLTGDIYTRTQLERLAGNEDPLKDLTDQQHIEERMFGSFEQAEQFFEESGFRVDKVADANFNRLSSIGYLLSLLSSEQLSQLEATPPFRATWRLKIN